MVTCGEIAMAGSAGSKYGILQDGVPTDARNKVMQKLEPYMKSEEKVSTRYFECACHGLHHTLAITHFKASTAHTPDEMYICMLMDDRINFFKRLWKGLRFAFLRRPFYAEFVIEDSVQVSDIVNTLEEFREFREFGESGDEKERVYKFRSPRIVK